MELEYIRNRIIEMLAEADAKTIRLVYRFVCGLIYK